MVSGLRQTIRTRRYSAHHAYSVAMSWRFRCCFSRISPHLYTAVSRKHANFNNIDYLNSGWNRYLRSTGIVVWKRRTTERPSIWITTTSYHRWSVVPRPMPSNGCVQWLRRNNLLFMMCSKTSTEFGTKAYLLTFGSSLAPLLKTSRFLSEQNIFAQIDGSSIPPVPREC